MQPWGPMEIPAGRDGITRMKNPSLTRPSHLAAAESVLADRFMFEKMPGASKINTVALSGSVTAHHDFIYGVPTLTQELVACVDNGATAEIVTVNGSGLVATVKSGMASGGFPWFVEGWDSTRKVLYYFNAQNTPQVYAGGGGASSDIPSIPNDWSTYKPTAAAATKTRMVAWGNKNQPHSLYLSTVGNHSDFTGPESALEIVYPGIGQRIVGGLSHKDRFFVGKYPNGIIYIDDSDPSIANWTRDIVTQAVGLSGPGCWVDIGDDVLILSTDGYFYLLSQVQTQGQTSVPPFMPQETADFIKENMNLSYLHLTRSVWFGHKRQAWFAVPKTASTSCDAWVILDLNEVGNPKLFWSTRDVCLSVAMRKGSITAVAKPSFGDDDGFIWQGDQAARNKGDLAYNAQYETVPVAVMPGGITRANLAELQVVMEPTGNYDLELEVLRDGVPSQVLTYSMQTPGAGSGSISLDSDVIAGQTIATVRHRLEGDCRYIKLIGRNDNVDENFAVASHIVRAEPGNERQ